MNLEIILTFHNGYLRVLKPNDVTFDYVSGLNNPEINKYLDTVRQTTQTTQSVKEFISNNLQSVNSVMLGIWKKNNENICGTIRIHGIDTFHKIANIGVCIFEKSTWGHGLGSNAITTATKWAMDYLDLRWIEAGIHEDNIGSQKAFLNAGYEWITNIPGKYLFEGKPSVVKIYANRKV